MRKRPFSPALDDLPETSSLKIIYGRKCIKAQEPSKWPGSRGLLVTGFVVLFKKVSKKKETFSFGTNLWIFV